MLILQLTKDSLCDSKRLIKSWKGPLGQLAQTCTVSLSSGDSLAKQVAVKLAKEDWAKKRHA